MRTAEAPAEPRHETQQALLLSVPWALLDTGMTLSCLVKMMKGPPVQIGRLWL